MEPEDGLIFFPSPYSPPLGYSGVEIRLTDARGNRYFDARRALFPVEAAGVLRRAAVEHPYRLAGELRFVPGRIHLEAFDGDQLEIVTFGGWAAMTVAAGTTVCRVTSTAPFLPLNEGVESPFVVMESELEALLAQSRAVWGRDEYRHLDRLADLDPMTLFVASVRTLEERPARLAHVEGDPATRLALHQAREMRRTLERAGHWPAAAADLPELLND